MSADVAAKQLADCPHTMPIRMGAAMRCPFCGSMKTDGPWAFPHLVAAFVAEWRKEHPDDVAR